MISLFKRRKERSYEFPVIYPDLEEYISQNYVGARIEKGYADAVMGAAAHQDGKPKMRLMRPHAMSKPQDMPMMSAERAGMAMPMEADVDQMLGFAVEEEASEPDFGEAISERIKHVEDPFGVYLLYLIQSKGKTNAQVYGKAIITKQSFAKLKKDPVGYHPDKLTALQYCVGCELNIDETKDLLARAGYALSPADKRDIIFSYFISHEAYDMIDIDIALEEHGIPCIIK